MKVDRVFVGYKRTWQTASFESLTEEIQISAELEEGDDVESSIKQLQSQSHQLVCEHARPILEASGRLEPIETEKIAGLEVAS